MTPAIVEEFIDGRELYVGVMGNERLQVFPVWEMSFSKMPDNNWRIATERVKWSVKYQKKHGIDTTVAALSDEMSAKVQHLAKRVYRALDLSGYARIDLRMKADGQLYVIEANPNPQLAQGEDFAESAKRAGVSYAKLIERIIGLGLQWRPSRMA
jgi:D-alanine-D-alanine ligase